MGTESIAPPAPTKPRTEPMKAPAKRAPRISMPRSCQSVSDFMFVENLSVVEIYGELSPFLPVILQLMSKPSVLFVCIHNVGRSQMAAAFLSHLLHGEIDLRSAGTEPVANVNPAVIEAMKSKVFYRGVSSCHPGRLGSIWPQFGLGLPLSAWRAIFRTYVRITQPCPGTLKNDASCC